MHIITPCSPRISHYHVTQFCILIATEYSYICYVGNKLYTSACEDLKVSAYRCKIFKYLQLTSTFQTKFKVLCVNGNDISYASLVPYREKVIALLIWRGKEVHLFSYL